MGFSPIVTNSALKRPLPVWTPQLSLVAESAVKQAPYGVASDTVPPRLGSLAMRRGIHLPVFRSYPLRRFCYALVHRVCVAATALILLSGCVTTQPVPQVVKVPIATPCLTADQLPKPPQAATDATLSAMTDFDLVINLAADRLEYRRYSTEAAAVLQACTK